MKKICTFILILYSRLLFSQQMEALDTINFVQSCDTNSHVSNMMMVMNVPKLKVPRAVITNEKTFYRLKSKTNDVIFSFKKEQDNKISVWVDELEKHCFIIEPPHDYLFKNYFLSNDLLEVYGRIKCDDYYRNFCIIFNLKTKHVYFDLDDSGFKQK